MHRAETKATAFLTTPGAGADAHMSNDALRTGLPRRSGGSGLLGPAKACAAWASRPVSILVGEDSRGSAPRVAWLQTKSTVTNEHPSRDARSPPGPAPR